MITIFTEHGKLQGSCPEAMGCGVAGAGETCVLVCDTPVQMKILKTEITLLLLMYDFKKKNVLKLFYFAVMFFLDFPVF